MSHTPAPWTVGPRGCAVYGPDNMRLAALDANAKTLGQRTDNARLIAAAPDLLAALVAYVENTPDMHPCKAAAVAAIAKAKAEAP